MKAASTGAALGPQDLVVVALKNNALSAVAAELPALLKPDTQIVFAVNGLPWWFFDAFGGPLAGTRIAALDPDGRLERLIPLARIVWGVVNFSVHDRGDGAIEHTNNRHLMIGRPSNDHDGLAAICDLFAQGGFVCGISDNIRRDTWAKLSVNVAVNLPSALTGAKLFELVRDPLTFETMERSLAEMRAVGVKLGIDPGVVALDVFRDANVKTSMLQDMERGRPLETASIVEAPLEVAEKAGVPMPVVRALASLILLKQRLSLGA